MYPPRRSSSTLSPAAGRSVDGPGEGAVADSGGDGVAEPGAAAVGAAGGPPPHPTSDPATEAANARCSSRTLLDVTYKPASQYKEVGVVCCISVSTWVTARPSPQWGDMHSHSPPSQTPRH